jgi:adenosine kinase
MDILLSGSVAFDYLMTFPGNFKDHILHEHLDRISLSFLVDSMERLNGGVAPNIAYTMALLGQRPRLWATVGEDFSEYRAFLENVGVDTSGARVVPGVFTASFFVNTDLNNAQIASFYPGAMAHAIGLSLKDLGSDQPDIVVISPNDPDAMNKNIKECLQLDIPYIYDPSQQIVRLQAKDLEFGIRGAYALFGNDYEYALIKKMTGLEPKDVLENHQDSFTVVTEGEKGAKIYTNQGLFQTPVVPPKHIVDPTGVGDAFRGGFLTGYSFGFPMEVNGRMGALAATYCLEQKGPQSHSFTPQEFINRYRNHFDDQGQLDLLL